MTLAQQTFFFVHDEPMVAALQRISTRRQRPPSYQAFVRELGSLMTTRSPGSLILAGVPSAVAATDASADLIAYLEFAKSNGACEASAGLAEIEIPYSPNIRTQQNMLADVYSGAPISALGHRHRPQFSLALGTLQLRPEPLVRLCGIVDALPTKYYLVRGAHLLRPAGTSFYEAQNQLRFFVQLGRQTGRTHVLFASAVVIAQWLETAEIAHEVDACFLRPYGNAQGSLEEFTGLLQGYDEIIPRIDGFELASYADTFRRVVSGCPYRLNKWVATAISNLLAHGESRLSWDHLRAAAPSPAEQQHAQDDFNEIRKFTTPLEPEPAGPMPTVHQRRKRSTRPGEQKPRRDPVAQNVA